MMLMIIKMMMMLMVMMMMMLRPLQEHRVHMFFELCDMTLADYLVMFHRASR
jgi:hypothetical protein